MSNLSDMIGTEIDKRIETIADPAYEPVPRIGKTDVILAVVLCVVSLAIMIYAYNVLC